MADDRRSPWVYVALGCGCLVLLVVAAVAAIGVVGYRATKTMAENLKDPVKREAGVKQVLGCDTIPDGYHAAMSVTVPLVMEMAVITDVDPDSPDHQGGKNAERAFFYFKSFNMGQDQDELHRYFAGEIDDPEVLRRNYINIDHTDETLGRGVLETTDGKLLYMVSRGEAHVAEGATRGLLALLLIECPEDKKTRIAMWIGPDPDGSAGFGDAALQGTPADPEAIEAFVSDFKLCGS